MRNTSQVGQVTVAQVIRTLTQQGKYVLLPFGDHRRYDLVFEDEEGRFFRVQCKTAWVSRGTLRFATCSVDSRSAVGRTLRKGYQGEVDLFGVYCPATDRVYLVPVNDVPVGEGILRLEPPRNNQQTGIRWARDYEAREAAQPGRRSGLPSPAAFGILLRS